MSKSVLDIGKIGKKCEIGAFPNDLLIKAFPSHHSFPDETKLSENGTFDFSSSWAPFLIMTMLIQTGEIY